MKSNVSPLLRVSDLKSAPSSAVTLCGAVSSFVQVIFWPTLASAVWGTNLMSFIEIVTVSSDSAAWLCVLVAASGVGFVVTVAPLSPASRPVSLSSSLPHAPRASASAVHATAMEVKRGIQRSPEGRVRRD